MNRPKKIEILSLFPDRESLGFDYYGIEVRFDGQVIATFGDGYHDSGYQKAQGFLKGVALFLGDLPSPIYKEVVRKGI